MMAGIKGKNTKPELLLRKALHRLGFRYSLHSKKIPGRPDIVFPARKSVIFVHGCFWHGHDCILGRPIPNTRRVFWTTKIDRNRKRDAEVRRQIAAIGWRFAVVWECAIRGRSRIGLEETSRRVAAWLRSSDQSLIEVRGDA